MQAALTEDAKCAFGSTRLARRLRPRRSRLPMCVPAPLAVTLVWVLAEGVITRWINSSTP